MATGATWLYKNAGTATPLVAGINKVKIVLKTGVGITKFNVGGKNADYAFNVPGGLPLKATLVIDTPNAPTGQCCEFVFPASPPATPSCTLLGTTAGAACKEARRPHPPRREPAAFRRRGSLSS